MIMGGVGIRDSKKYIVTAGLTLHLDNSSTSYSGLTGITWSDISGNNRRFGARTDFVGTATPNYTKDDKGYFGFELNGFTNTFSGAYYFRETSTPTINFNTSWTIEVLCKPNAAGRTESDCGGGGGGGSILFVKPGDGSNTTTQRIFAAHYFGASTALPTGTPFAGANPPDISDLIRVSYVSVGTCSATNSFVLSPGTLYGTQRAFRAYEPFYVSCVFDKLTASTYSASLYFNGVLWGTAGPTTFLNAPNGTFNIGGRDYNCSQNGWRGWIYNFRMYDRALTAAEIKQNFEALRGKAGL